MRPLTLAGASVTGQRRRRAAASQRAPSPQPNRWQLLRADGSSSLSSILIGIIATHFGDEHAENDLLESHLTLGHCGMLSSDCCSCSAVHLTCPLRISSRDPRRIASHAYASCRCSAIGVNARERALPAPPPRMHHPLHQRCQHSRRRLTRSASLSRWTVPTRSTAVTGTRRSATCRP